MASTTSGGTSSMPWASRACDWISANSAASSSFRATHSQPSTTSPQRNCFMIACSPSLRILASTSTENATGGNASTISRMCRILAYLGEPLPLRHLLYDPDNSLVTQSYSPRMMNTFLNLAGFGMKAWTPAALRPQEPLSYRATTLPSFDRNLRSLSSQLAPTCLVAH